MDLRELRGYIESQKLRLEEEKSELVSKRRAFLSGTEDFTFSEAKPKERSKVYSRDELNVSEVSDAICARINDLNAFKDQVINHPREDGYVEQRKPNTLLSNGNNGQMYREHSTAAEKSNVEAVADEPELSVCKEDKSPLQPAYLKYEQQDTKLKSFQDSQRGKERKEHKSPFHSREEEVEHLQNKLASASFWDDFGRSATAKRWSAHELDTMVRVGEFSPANPDLQAPGRALLGLGEYEERRRQLLEKKKQEYKEYLNQNRNQLQRTDHFEQPSVASGYGYEASGQIWNTSANPSDTQRNSSSVDATTQTDSWLAEQLQNNVTTSVALPLANQALSVVDSPLQGLSPRVPRTHSSQTTDQMPDARMRQLQLQEELRLQIEEKRRLEAERREQERQEEEALQRRVAEQQARLQAEYERDEKLRREREIQKQHQIEDFQRRQEELRAESEALKLEERRQKSEAAESYYQKQAKSAHLVPPSQPASVSVLSRGSPPLRSPRRGSGEESSNRFRSPPSPRALIKVLEGPTLPKPNPRLEDSLPIPLMPVAHTYASGPPSLRSPRRSPRTSPRRSPHRSPQRSPHESPRRSPARFGDLDWEDVPAAPHWHHKTSVQKPSEAMRDLEERWKVPAVQKNVCVRGKTNAQNSTGNVLTQLGAFRRQLQMEHMRMEEKMRERYQPNLYQQQLYQQNAPQPRHYN